MRMRNTNSSGAGYVAGQRAAVVGHNARYICSRSSEHLSGTGRQIPDQPNFGVVLYGRDRTAGVQFRLRRSVVATSSVRRAGFDRRSPTKPSSWSLT